MTSVNPSKLRAVYYEDHAEQFEAFAPDLRRILEFKSDDVEIVWAPTKVALAKALEARPHVVFCDNEHTGIGPHEGLHAIQRHKPDHPDTLFCLVTSLGIRTQTLGSYTPNPDVFIYKGQLGVPAYQEYIGRKLRKQIRRSPFPKFEVAFDLEREGPRDAKNKPMTRQELHSIVEQVVDTEGVRVLASEFQTAELEVITGGFSGSGVYNLLITRGEGRPNIPAILKVSERGKATQEFQNFLQFVKWRLPYLWRVDVLGTGYTGRFGAICYSPALGGFEPPVAVNDFIRRGEFQVIDRVLASVLHSKNQTWYGEQRPSEKDIREYFGGGSFHRTPWRREVLEDRFYQYLISSLREADADFVETADYTRIFDTKYPIIDRLVFTRNWGQVTECVCHGDMNGNNLLYGGGDAPVVFIDFQDTGFAHVFRDFVSFESSVRLEFPHDEIEGESELELFKRCLAAERRLGEAGWAAVEAGVGYVGYISKIRAAANLNFPNEPLALYLVANIVHHLWLFEKSGSWAVHKRTRMAATILESTLALQHLLQPALAR